MSPIDGPNLTLAPEIAGLVLLGLARAEPVRVGPSGAELDAEIESLQREVARSHSGEPPSEIPALRPARDLYRAFGIDPTKTRPSSEALMRRVLRGDPLPRIINAVDVGNYCSLRFALPIGLYDVSKIHGPVTLRRGRVGETYPGIRKDDVRLEGRPTLADHDGPFGNPTSDSFRTSVDEHTRSLWMVIFAPAAFSRDRMAEHVSVARWAMARFLTGGAEPETAGGVV